MVCQGLRQWPQDLCCLLKERAIAGTLWRTHQPAGCLTCPGVKGSGKLDGQPKEQAGLILLRYIISSEAFQLHFC